MSVLIIARALGPTGRGEVVFLIAIASIVSRLAAFGIQEANVNIGAAEPRLRRVLATNSFLFALALGSLAAGVTAALIGLFPVVGRGASGSLHWLALAAIPMLLLYTYLLRLVYADDRIKIANIAWLVPFATAALLNAILAAAGALSVTSAFAAWLTGQAVATALLVWYVGCRLGGFGRPSATVGRRTALFGIKTHAGRVMLVGNNRLDQWILGAMAGPRELGLYSIAVAWVATLFYLPSALALVHRADLVRTSTSDAARGTAIAFRSIALVTGVAVLAIIVVAPFLCVTVFGEEFRGSIDDLRVLALGALGIVALKILGNALIARNRPLLETAAIGVGLACTIVLDIVLIPRYGGFGAALASAVAYSAAGGVVTILFLRALGGSADELVPRATDVPDLAKRVARLRHSGDRLGTPRASAEAGGAPARDRERT